MWRGVVTATVKFTKVSNRCKSNPESKFKGPHSWKAETGKKNTGK